METAIYVGIGALATALLFLLALPAVSRRAFRLAQARARLLAPLSVAEAQAERDALRGRHAVEAALVERRAEASEGKWSQAQIALGGAANDIARRDDEIADKAGEIARQRAELAAQATELRARESESGAREIAMRDFEGQRDAAERRSAASEDARRRAETETEATRASLEDKIDALAREMTLAQRRADGVLLAAQAKIADLERRLAEAEDEAFRLRRQAVSLGNALAAAQRDTDSRLAEAARRESDLGVRLQALLAAQEEGESALRAARAERDAEREAKALRDRLAAQEAEADAELRQAISRLAREWTAQSEIAAASRRETVS